MSNSKTSTEEKTILNRITNIFWKFKWKIWKSIKIREKIIDSAVAKIWNKKKQEKWLETKWNCKQLKTWAIKLSKQKQQTKIRIKTLLFKIKLKNNSKEKERVNQVNKRKHYDINLN
jgi:hypothetical protein